MKTLITLLGIMLFSMAASAQDGPVYEYLTMFKKDYDLHICIGETPAGVRILSRSMFDRCHRSVIEWLLNFGIFTDTGIKYYRI